LKDSDDGVTGNGILKNNGDTIILASDEQTYTNSILKNGALPIGVLKAATRLTDNVIKRLRDSWANLYNGAGNAGKTIILEEGLDYKPISMRPDEMDLTNMRKNTVSEVARIFNLPESMINAAANKYASNEQNNIHFLQYCVSPIINSIEAALNKSLLLESEKEKGYYFRFDTSEILRTTEKEKVETTVTAMTKGLLSINEARAKIDVKALDVDYFMWGLGNIFYNPKTNDMIIPNLGKVVDPDKPESLINPAQNPNQINNTNNNQNINDDGATNKEGATKT
jgi:HK97 family phage portal protein